LLRLELDILPTTESYLRITNPHLQTVCTQVYAETERFPRVYSRRDSLTKPRRCDLILEMIRINLV